MADRGQPHIIHIPYIEKKAARLHDPRCVNVPRARVRVHMMRSGAGGQ